MNLLTISRRNKLNEEEIKVKKFLFEGDRAQIRMSTVRSALEIILKEIDTGN